MPLENIQKRWVEQQTYRSLLRLIKYVLGTKDYTLKMKPRINGDNLLNIEQYSDSDYVSDIQGTALHE